jgi:hypothetical protein
MSGGNIDYSKWDHLDEYSSDDEDHGEQANETPRVTRLDAPSRVTFGGGEAAVNPQQSVSVATTTATAPQSTNSSTAFGPKSAANNNEATWTQKGGVVKTTCSTTNRRRQLYWSQDRYSVSLRLELTSEDEKVQTVQVTGVLPYADRHCATGSNKPRLIIRSSSNSISFLEGDLPHNVHLAQQDEEEDMGIDWSIETVANQKFVVVILYKAAPMHRMVVWWRRPLMEFDEIEMESSNVPASQEFVQAWDEAHRLFREKRQAEKKTIMVSSCVLFIRSFFCIVVRMVVVGCCEDTPIHVDRDI